MGNAIYLKIIIFAIKSNQTKNAKKHGSIFRFWFSREEIQELSRHNRQYETPRLEQELVMLYFRKPGENEHGQFVTAARAMNDRGKCGRCGKYFSKTLRVCAGTEHFWSND